RKTGRFQEARSAYEKALSIFPGYHPARRNLGVLCDLYLGDLDCALDAYNAYMATVPADPEVAMWIADTRNRLGIQE
ncbi:MAG: tetratricopeptide repeat protein, partial [Woeseiaceae bacterium]